MTKRVTSQIRVGGPYSNKKSLHWTAAFLAAGLLAACSSSTDAPPPKDSAIDRTADRIVDPGIDLANDLASDKAGDTGNKDLATDLPSAGCTMNGQNFAVGASITIAGNCPTICRCLSVGNVDCTSNCPTDTNQVDKPDAPSTPDTPITCTRNGKSYAPGESVPNGDGCGNTCVCLSNGTMGACSGTCPPDAGPDVNKDTQPDITIPIDTACIVNTQCNQANGSKGLCPAGVCKACAGAQDDATCAAIYGAGNICADGACVPGTCHDSTVCTGSKVCDTTHTCKNCASDLQCQNDTVYGRGTICLTNGQCVPGNCRVSSECQGNKLCDTATHLCSTCTTDNQCQADVAYGAKSICVSAQCVDGSCSSTTTCKPSGRLCPATGTNKICAACTTDTQCKNDTAYGSSYICADGQCVSGTCNSSANCANGRICNTTSHVCVACASDLQCTRDTTYGANSICLSNGSCVTGDCHDISSECSTGRLCGSTLPHICGDCTQDSQCIGDGRYGTGFICVNRLCARGDCHDLSSECTGSKEGLVCGGVTTHTCGTCSSDTQCKNDTHYPNTICHTVTGEPESGKCVSKTCTNPGYACTANPSDFCCTVSGATTCVAGNCCQDSDCNDSKYFCRNNTCTLCDGVTGNSYLVDPLNGDDVKASGSGTTGGGATALASCSFRTIKKALEVIGTPTVATTITIVGQTGSTPTPLYTVQSAGGPSSVETLPIAVPANVTIKTKTGPIKLNLGIDKTGFTFAGDNSGLAPLSTASLTIQGTDNHTSAEGIVVDTTVAGRTVSLSNLSIINTGGHGIQVKSGIVNIGSGVRVASAGLTGNKRSGLDISGGTVNIAVANTADPITVFESNTLYGIALANAAILNISGVTLTTADLRTVVTRSNASGNVFFNQTTTTATPSNITGLYSGGSPGDGMLITAGSNIKVRNCVFQGNTGSGIRINGAPNVSVANIDLGTSATGTGTAGKNILQTSTGTTQNGGAGLCVALGATAAAFTPTLNARGNQFAGYDCSATSPGTLVTSTLCTGGINLGVIPATNVTVTVDALNCNVQR
jgi:hypothetical protein